MSKKTLIIIIFALIFIVSHIGVRFLWASDILNIFLKLPSEQCGSYSTVERQRMIDNIKDYPGGKGRSSVPDVEEPWLRLYSTNTLVLERPVYGSITYKLFQGATGNTQLLAICRGRQSRNSPSDPKCPFDLCLYRSDIFGLTEVRHDDYLPSISVLDFITKETLEDPNAVRDITDIGMEYNHCLTCSVSINDAVTLDIVTSAAINASICGRLLPGFGLLPLTWNGIDFSKPYDRAAPTEGVNP